MRAAQRPANEGQRTADEDRLSQLDEAFLYMERPNQPMQIGCVAEVDGRFERDELIAVLRERLTPIARFRQRPAHSTLNLRGVRWEEDPLFDVAQHVRHVAAPAPGDQAALQHVVETLFATPLQPDRPLWEVHVIDGLQGGRSALLCKVHHCMSDGISALGVMERIADPRDGGDDVDAGAKRASSGATDDARGRAAASAPKSGSATRALPGAIGGFLQRLLSSVPAEPASLLDAVRDVGSAVDAVASFLQEPITTLPFHGRLGHGRRMIWRSFPFDEIDSLRVAGDCTVNDAILTVLSGALRTFLDEEGVCPDDARVRMLVPMSVRRPGADTSGLGNLVTAVFPWLPVDEEDPLVRARRVRQEMRDIKGREMGRATAIVLGALGLVPSAVEAAALRLLPDVPLVSAACTNVRGPAEPLRLLGRRITEIHPIMNLFQGVGLTFAVASYAGRMSICAATDPRLLPNGDRLMQTVEEALYELRTEYWRNSAAMKLARGIAERTPPRAQRANGAARTATRVADERVAHERVADERAATAASARVSLPPPAAAESSAAAKSPAAPSDARSRASATSHDDETADAVEATPPRRPRAAVDVDLLTDPDLSFADQRFLRANARERGAAEAPRNGGGRGGSRAAASRRSARNATVELDAADVTDVSGRDEGAHASRVPSSGGVERAADAAAERIASALAADGRSVTVEPHDAACAPSGASARRTYG